MASIWFDKGWGNSGYGKCVVIAADGMTYVADDIIGDSKGMNIECQFRPVPSGVTCYAFDSNNNGNNSWNSGVAISTGQIQLNTVNQVFTPI